MVVDNATGDVLAYVGSADFDNERIDGQVDMIQALRQPGSTLKPFIYELAFERGHDGAEMLADVPTTFGNATQRTYMPLNFGGTFEGPVSAREALAGSLNVPVVRLLAEIGPADMLARLHDLGFASLDRAPAHYGLSLALGSGEVRLQELAAAYVALARGGEKIPLRMRATDPEPQARRVMPAEIAAEVAEILADPLARVRGLHGRGPFDLGFPVAVKTGTSAGYRDTLCAGFTRERTVVVWVGNADGAPTHELTGATGAGPLFADVMRRSMDDVKTRAPLFEAGLLKDVEVCPLSGKRPGAACPDRAQRLFPRERQPEETCPMHVRATATTPHPSARAVPVRSRGRSDDRADARGARGVAAHGAAGRAGARSVRDAVVPALVGVGVRRGADEPAEVSVTSPAPGSVFLVSNRPADARQAIEVRASVTGGDGALPASVDFFLDGKAVARSRWPYATTIRPTPGDHEIVALPSSRERARACGPRGSRCGEVIANRAPPSSGR